MASLGSVFIEGRFQRSIRIDTDLRDPDALAGFVCPGSSASVLENMANHISEGGQGAFTWTGPYGSGKSSLVIALNALLSGNQSEREAAKQSVGHKTAEKVWAALPPDEAGWKSLPVVGQRADARRVIGDALVKNGLADNEPEEGWSDDKIIQAVMSAANDMPGKTGLIIFIDEMGKLLESAARDGTDLYLFQQLAEIASRSDGKLVLIGILHQAFAEYANRLSRDARDEWSKIQGRFVDLSVNVAGEEQIDLLSRAIHSDPPPAKLRSLSDVTAKTIRAHKPGVSDSLSGLLQGTWPLHPVVSALLGPISRRRFGQNQRSLFGFLNSAEPNGFQDYLRSADDEDLYSPSKLWDYLRVNLEPSIISSPDGHRWVMAAEAIDRCEAHGGTETHIELLKTIAVLDLFRERSGLYPSTELLSTTVNAGKDELEKVLNDLLNWSFVIYRKHISSFAIYAGSDFDIESAVDHALSDVHDVNFETLHRMAGMQPVLAKRHYFTTGALRWFNVQIGSITAVSSNATQFEPHQSTIGLYLLALPTEGEDRQLAIERCQNASKKAAAENLNVIVGFPLQAWKIIELAKELKALEKVREEHPEIQGDLIARREIKSRMLGLQSQLEAELQQALLNAMWFEGGKQLPKMNIRALNNKASEIAERDFPRTPLIPNELLNRTKPSSSAIAAQNALLKAMVNNLGQERVGIEGFPAEGGLFDSLLSHTGLYQAKDGTYDFHRPEPEDKARLHASWKIAVEYLEKHSDRAVPLSEIFDRWEAKPIGMKRGLMPVFAVAFINSYRNELAYYRDGFFQPLFTDLDVDYLAKDPESIQLRWMDLSHLSKRLLSGLAETVRKLDGENKLTELEPIDVARGLVAIFDRISNWTKRTQRISANAAKLRTILKNASDPNQLLFTDLPALYQEDANIHDDRVADAIVKLTDETLQELVSAYPKMLERISSILLTELQATSDSTHALGDLRERAENIKQMSGDFRVDAFINRIARFDGAQGDIEGIGSLAANKPPSDWVDADLDRAFLEIGMFCENFIKTETYARVQGREDKRQSIAVILSNEGSPTPRLASFQITESQREDVRRVTERIRAVIDHDTPMEREIILAALAQISGEFIASDEMLPEEELDAAE